MIATFAAFASVAAESPHPVHRVSLADPGEASTPEGRERLAYLIGCALPEDLVVETDVGGEHLAFAGHLGLAPAWQQRAMTAAEARWVSGCMLARTNAFGVSVQISLRAERPPTASLDTSEEERRRFAFHEAGFFGNLFTEDAPAYVCTGAAVADRARQLEALRRVCSLDSEEPGLAGFSRCHFIVAGPCSARPFVQDGVDYSHEVVHVFLATP